MINQRKLNRDIKNLSGDIIAYRRDFHRHAESGWTEFRTSALIAERLEKLGYQIALGTDILTADERMGLPPADELEICYQRAIRQGGPQKFMLPMRGGYTGVVAELDCGPGPAIGYRFDLDALPLQESQDLVHRPFREQFASINDGVMHACGHDGHAAIGLGLAQLLVQYREQLQGRFRLIFQPAEEGVRGAKAMVSAGVVDDLDVIIGCHVYSGWAPGEYSPGMGGYAATQKLDAWIRGKPAHAGGSPQLGRNALLAAATAVLNLYAIGRHAEGPTRINVGRLEAGLGRNVIPEEAHLVLETRGSNSSLNSYMTERAVRILQTAAEMYDCSLEIIPMGSAPSAESDPALRAIVEQLVRELGQTVVAYESRGGSEDFTYLMNRVQANGGMAVNIGIGADLQGISSTDELAAERIFGHHTREFDFDETVLMDGLRLLTKLTFKLVEDRT